MKILTRILAAIGAITLFGFLIMMLFLMMMPRKSVPSKVLLEVNLEQDFPETIAPDPLTSLIMRDSLTLRDVVDAIDRAAKDERVVGLVARVGASSLSMAKAQELRDAIKRLQEAGKFTIAHSETFGEFGPGNAAYYLASVFNEVYLQPSGDVGLTGIMMEAPFLKGSFEKIGIKFKGDHRYEYKNAFNTYTETQFTEPHKEALLGIMNSWFEQLKEGITKERKLDPNAFKSLIDNGPYLGKEALEAKLVDGLLYRDEAYEKAKERAGEGAQLLYLGQYLSRAGRPHQSGERIALIYGAGQVTRGKSQFSSLQGTPTMGSESVASAIRAAVADKYVKAILFRVDSPGGSYVASDTIWREVVKAKEAGKPVIVSMGSVAGSGGYFVAMHANKIVAQPGTITGSIGVLGGKILTSELWEKLGLSWDEIHIGENSTMFTGTQDYTEGQWARFQAWLDRVYEDFTSKVAEGRNLPKEKVLELAKGRIWSGEDAKKAGLVDELGGFETALRLAKSEAGIEASAEVNVTVFPKPKGFFESLFSGQGPENSDKEGVKTFVTEVAALTSPLIKTLKLLGMLSQNEQDNVLLMRHQH